MIAPAPPSGRRLVGFDGLRLLAAVSIVAHHAAFMSGATFDSAGGPYFARADVGVAVFFVLSGFLLYRPFVARQITGRGADSGFYVRRATRIYPAYWVALATTLIIGGTAVGDVRGLALTATLTQVYVPERFLSGLQQSWSLAAEVAFYAVLPLIAAAAWAWARQAAEPRRPARLLAVAGGVYGASIVARCVSEWWLPPRYAAVAPLWMPCQLDHFALGMALAVLSVWAATRGDLRDLLARTFGGVGRWWLVAAALFWFVSTQLELARGLDRSSFASEVARQGVYGLIGLCLVAPLVFTTADGPVRRFLDHPVLVWGGTLSYGLYLWHLWFIERLPGWADFPPFSGWFPQLFLAGLVFGLAAAALTWRLVEDPLNRRARRAHHRTPAVLVGSSIDAA